MASMQQSQHSTASTRGAGREDDAAAAHPLFCLVCFRSLMIRDYAPSTAVTAMFYPVVEMPLVLYIVLNFLRLRQAYRAGQVGAVRFAVCNAFLPLELTFTLWFRMIFVVHAFDDVSRSQSWHERQHKRGRERGVAGKALFSHPLSSLFSLSVAVFRAQVVGHTIGFHGLMIALCLVALQNFLYHDSIGRLVGPRWVSLGYLLALWAVTLVKLVIVWAIFSGTPLWSTSNEAGNAFAHAMDICWMVLAAVVPIVLAYKSRQSTPAMDIAFDQQTPATAAILEKRGEAF